jgi:hypothetical protein
LKGAEARSEQFAALQVLEMIGRRLILYTQPEALRLTWHLFWQQVMALTR